MNKTLKVGDVGYVLGRAPIKILKLLPGNRCIGRYLRDTVSGRKNRKRKGQVAIFMMVWNYPINEKYHYPNQDGK